MRKIELTAKRESIERVVFLTNASLTAFAKECASVLEIELTESLLWRFVNGLEVADYFTELATDYIAQMQPMPLESVKKIVYKDFADRIPSGEIHDALRMLRLNVEHFTYVTGKPLVLESTPNGWQVDSKLVAELLTTCTVTATPMQEEYLTLLDTVINAKEAVQAYEVANSIAHEVGIVYLQSGDAEIIANRVD